MRVRRQIYAKVQEKASALLDSALDVLVPNSVPVTSEDSLDGLVAVNTIDVARREIVKVPMSVARGLDDAALQRSFDGEAYVLFDAGAGASDCKPVSINDASLSTSGSSARGTSGPPLVRPRAGNVLMRSP